MRQHDLNWLVTHTEPKASKMIHQLREQGITHEELLALMGTLPRHEFVEPAFSHLAYSATPLPIGRNYSRLENPSATFASTPWPGLHL